MDIWELYERFSDIESRGVLSVRQRQLVAICDLRQEVNAGGFDNYLRAWGADTATEALALLPEALGTSWAEVAADALSVLGTAAPTNAHERGYVLDRAAEADDVLGLADDRFLALESEMDADVLLSRTAEELSPWPKPGRSRGLFRRATP